MDRGKRTQEVVRQHEQDTFPTSRAVSFVVVREEGIHCPICLLPTGRRMRGKLYCGNCGYIDS